MKGTPKRKLEVHRSKPRSDQAPGEEVVQVNDKYMGGLPPEDERAYQDPQHKTPG